jgi:hypothetical protein
LAEETRKAKEATRVQQAEESRKSEVAPEQVRAAKDKAERKRPKGLGLHKKP